MPSASGMALHSAVFETVENGQTRQMACFVSRLLWTHLPCEGVAWDLKHGVEPFPAEL